MTADWRLAVDIGGTFTDVVLFDGASGHVVVDKTLTKMRLLATHGERAGEDRVRDAATPGRLEAVVHAPDIELERGVRRELADEIGEIDQPLGARFLNCADHVVELGHVATHHFHLVAKSRERGRRAGDIDVHARDVVARRH